ncbi:MAG: Crp/Fnr family transcriptional regulator [Clostridiales bacterium]|jgi:CRP-like cAMP-binding protein|nr:Crp/Fnr family transcriptional regulator [Clostridiales bacterium]
MKDILEAARDNELFSGIECEDFAEICSRLSLKAVRYKKDEIIMLCGAAVTFIGIILSGEIKIIKEDERGNVSMLTELSAPDTFGDVLACAGIMESPVTVMARSDAHILQIGSKNILSLCDKACAAHRRFVENLLRAIARKSFLLNRKIEILSRRSTREKLLAFLDFYGRGEKLFRVPYNREEMAHYLCVDRSAMSAELCRMRDEGLIRFDRNRFEIL